MSSLDLLGLLTQPLEYAFMRNGLLEVLLLSAASGCIGAFVVQRNLTFFAHALTHTIFPALVLAVVLRQSPFLGAAAGALLTLALVSALRLRSDVGEDSAVGVVFVALFALGVILVGLFHLRNPDVNAALTGSLLGIGQPDLLFSLAFVAAVAAVIIAVYHPLVLVSFDPESAQVLGLPVRFLDVALLGLVASTAVVSVKAIGVILTVAVLVTPAAAARLWVRRLPQIMLLSGALNAAAGIAGLYTAYYFPVAPAAVVVLGLTALFALSALFAPRGLLGQMLARVQERRPGDALPLARSSEDLGRGTERL